MLSIVQEETRKERPDRNRTWDNLFLQGDVATALPSWEEEEPSPPTGRPTSVICNVIYLFNPVYFPIRRSDGGLHNIAVPPRRSLMGKPSARFH